MNAFTPDSRLVADVTPSPNHGKRIGYAAPDAIVLHYTGLRRGEAEAAWRADPGGEALRWLRDPQSCVSSHYVVKEDGRILQLVPESRRAWHAGVSFWRGSTDLNSHSVGVEIVNAGHFGGLPDFPAVQIKAVIALCRDIAARHAIAPERVLAHSDIAPGRKIDPGERFPWGELAQAGVGHWVPPAPISEGRTFGPGEEGQPVRAIQAMFALYGYGLPLTGVYDQTTEDVVSAFQRRYRPALVDGRADASTLATLRDLIAALERMPAQVATGQEASV
ncbi:MAG: N-acetylmuramoyl-L-alanine amidase [Hyphomicrobiales bacterium]|nr:N-acetylmuramoyl-L-alanine amidase [Hyphomicrobiales bacterium]